MLPFALVVYLAFMVLVELVLSNGAIQGADVDGKFDLMIRSHVLIGRRVTNVVRLQVE